MSSDQTYLAGGLAIDTHDEVHAMLAFGGRVYGPDYHVHAVAGEMGLDPYLSFPSRVHRYRLFNPTYAIASDAARGRTWIGTAYRNRLWLTAWQSNKSVASVDLDVFDGDLPVSEDSGHVYAAHVGSLGLSLVLGVQVGGKERQFHVLTSLDTGERISVEEIELPPNVEQPCSTTFSSNGTPLFACVIDDALYARDQWPTASSQWERAPILKEGNITGITQSIDLLGGWHFVCQQAINGPSQSRATLSYLYRSPSGSWSSPIEIETPDDLQHHCAMAVDATGTVHIVTRGKSTTTIRYVHSSCR